MDVLAGIQAMQVIFFKLECIHRLTPRESSAKNLAKTQSNNNLPENRLGLIAIDWLLQHIVAWLLD